MISTMMWQKAVNSNVYDSGAQVSLNFHQDNLFYHCVTDLFKQKPAESSSSSTHMLQLNFWKEVKSLSMRPIITQEGQK